LSEKAETSFSHSQLDESTTLALMAY